MYPMWFRIGTLAVMLALLVANVANGGSEALSLAIAGGIFGAIALDQNARNRGGSE